MPASDTLRSMFEGDARRHVQATGGDDYELCFTAPGSSRDAVETAARDSGIAVTRIGRLVEGRGVRAMDANGTPWVPANAGYRHFSG